MEMSTPITNAFTRAWSTLNNWPNSPTYVHHKNHLAIGDRAAFRVRNTSGHEEERTAVR